MLSDDYNKKFYYSEEQEENNPIALCYICNNAIFSGYDHYKIGELLFENRSCALQYILSIANENDYREYANGDKMQFEEWIRAKYDMKLYQLND
jgi:hypothetical protein